MTSKANEIREWGCWRGWVHHDIAKHPCQIEYELYERVVKKSKEQQMSISYVQLYITAISNLGERL